MMRPAGRGPMAEAASRRCRLLPLFLLLRSTCTVAEEVETVPVVPPPSPPPPAATSAPPRERSRGLILPGPAEPQPSSPRIPRKLVLTSKQASADGLPESVQANLRRNLALDPDMEMRWLDDPACSDYLKEHFGPRFAERLESEPRGSFRGDLCRAAVLFREGGFYIDLDVQLHMPLARLVDNDTTFMAAFTVDGAILNALVAAEPRNAIMAETLRELRRWYDGESSHHPDEEAEKTTNEWMGPVTMLRGLRSVMQNSCPGVQLEQFREEPKWVCGAQRLRFYDERELDCYSGEDSVECPPSRRNAEFAGARFGIFVASSPDKRDLVAWPRFESCEDWGCKGGGWDEGATIANDAETPAPKAEDMNGQDQIPKDL